jgi:hypothetical protein
MVGFEDEEHGQVSLVCQRQTVRQRQTATEKETEVKAATETERMSRERERG